MGKDARIKKHRRSLRRGIASTPVPALPLRALRRSEVKVKTGSFSVMEAAHAFMRVHKLPNCKVQEALNWAAAQHQSGVDWQRITPIAPQEAPAAE